MQIADLAASSAKSDAARQRLQVRVTQIGSREQQEVVQRVVSTVIKDRLVSPDAMRFSIKRHSTEDDTSLQLNYLDLEDKSIIDSKSVHNHALGQLSSVAGIPRTYVSRLKDGKRWEKDLLVDNLNTLFEKGLYTDRKGDPARFLHRSVGDELRGFLSRSYNRKLMTAPMLRSFIEACAIHGAGPIESHTSDIRTSLKCVLPEVFEPVEGEYVAFGVNFANSDYGAGRLKISGTVMRVSSGTVSVLEDKYSRTHLGSIIQDSDIEMSDETADKESAAAMSAVKDTVNGLLEVSSVDRMLKAIQTAHENEIPWYKLKNQISAVLNKKEVDLVESLLAGGDAIIDLPPASKTDGGDPIATGWWAANTLGWMASKEEDSDRKSEIQALAGQIIQNAEPAKKVA